MSATPQSSNGTTFAYDIRNVLLNEINKMPTGMRESMNAFVYLLAIKQLIFMKKVGLYVETSPPVELSVLLAHRQLDVLLALDKDLSGRQTTPFEFIDRLLNRLLVEHSLYFDSKMERVSIH